MNSLYGAVANKGFRFFNSNVAETITLTGQYTLRFIEKYIDERLNKIFKTENHKYLIYTDTDSVAGDTIITVNGKSMTIADYYDSKSDFIKNDKFNENYVKKCSGDHTLTVNPETKLLEQKNISYVMKHKVKKRMYKIRVSGKEIICTEDHSLIVERDGKIIDIKPKDVNKNDKFLYLRDEKY